MHGKAIFIDEFLLPDTSGNNGTGVPGKYIPGSNATPADVLPPPPQTADVQPNYIPPGNTQPIKPTAHTSAIPTLQTIPVNTPTADVPPPPPPPLQLGKNKTWLYIGLGILAVLFFSNNKK
jgi:hypothetical protein